MVDRRSSLLGRQHPDFRVTVPRRVEARDDKLIWTPFLRKRADVESAGMLDAFVRITNAPDVVRFARRYGSLQICDHNLPASHNGQPLFTGEVSHARCYPREIRDGVFWDPLAVWFEYVSEARTILYLGATLNTGISTMSTDDGAMELVQRLITKDTEWAKAVMLLSVNRWLSMGAVRPLASWDDMLPGPGFILLAGGTFGLLAIQLMEAVCRANSVTICSGCGEPYFRQTRRPQRGRRNYCPSCSENGMPARDRQRKHRER